MIYLLIALGGAAGAVSRYAVDDSVSRWFGGTFPLGTLVINLTGSFVLGVLFALVVDRSALPSDIRAPVMIGFIGAYTTFSTWMLESARLMEGDQWLLAAVNLGGSVMLGLVAVFAGLAVGRAL
ncbi:MAG: fluoride efflux transporter CrcB [Chloroflexi bacterium]|nr:fluoride efflux transporter CrcB [Chloroflexota bacterium]